MSTTYTLGDLRRDSERLANDLGEFMNATFAVAADRLNEINASDFAAREQVALDTLRDNVRNMRDAAIREYELAVSEGNIVKQQIWQTRWQSYQNFETGMVGRTVDQLFDAQTALARSQFLTRELGAVPGLIINAKDAYSAYATGDDDEFGRAISGILGSILLTWAVSALLLIPGLNVVTVAVFLGITGILGREIGQGLWDNAEEIFGPFMGAVNWVFRRDPLVLDLDGDGIETTPIDPDNPVLFDHDGDGIRNATGWVSSDDGFLVLDRNGNGTVDSGRELFGDSTLLGNGETAEDGFAALAEEDTNHDGSVDASDARFGNLRVWRDLNQDGVSQAGELFTLQALGITAINVASVSRDQVLPNGNRIVDAGTYTRADGTQGSVAETHGTADVDLAEETFHREFSDEIPLAAGVTDLPNMGGSGRVRDLWEAASQSTDLRAVLELFSQATTRSGQLAFIDELLLDWAETAGMESMGDRASDNHYGLRWQQIGSAVNPGGGFFHSAANGGGSSDSESASSWSPEEIERRAQWDVLVARTQTLFTILEAFNGRYFFAMPADAFEGAHSGLAQVFMSDNDPNTPGGGGGMMSFPVIRLQISQAQLDALSASYDALRQEVYRSLAMQTRLLPLRDMIVIAADPSGTGQALDFTDLDNELHNRIQVNAVDGMADLIEFTMAMRQQLQDTSWQGVATMEQNLRALPVTPGLEALYSELGVRFGAAGATVSGASGSDILLADDAGSSLRGGAGGDVLYGGAGNDSLSGDDGSDLLIGHDGNDALYGVNGDDHLIGGAGNDSLFGGSGYRGGGGNDTLDGGTGNDYLMGGLGSDTYLFRRGDGQDILNNDSDLSGDAVDPTVDKVDVLQLGDDIAPGDVALVRSGESLIVKIAGTTDQVTIANYFNGDGVSTHGYALEQIHFADGTIWTVADVKAMVLLPTSGNDSLTGYASDDVINGADGNDTLVGAAGNDTLNGGAGTDTVFGGDGADSILGEAGNDTLYGAAGDDQLVGGDGDDWLYGGESYGGPGGNDTLDGGAGNDYLAGGFGSDTYLFGRGDGQDTLVNDSDSYYGNADPTVGKVDVLQFREGVLPSEVTLQRSGSNLIVKIAGTADQVLIANYFTGDGVSTHGYAVEQIRFADGTSWSVTDVKALVLLPTSANDTLTGYASNDVINGGEGNDTLDGLAGNDVLNGGAGADTVQGGDGADTVAGDDGDDTLYGAAGDDQLLGGAGNDSLYGGESYGSIGGNDTLDGGAGNDYLMGGFGSDTYLFGRGDGQDTLNNDSDSYYGIADPLVGKIDALLFKAGVAPGDVALARSGNNLIVRIAGTTDQVTILNYFNTTGASIHGYSVEQIRFADGTIWDVATVNAKVQQGTEGADTLYAPTTGGTLYGLGGNDTLQGNNGADVLDGGAGNDTLYGNAGADSLDGGDGSDTLYGSAGDDQLVGGAGNDSLYGGESYGNIGGNDTLDGGAGNDYLMGGFGSDTYLFGRGDGQDTLVNDSDNYYGTADPLVGKIDVLQFKAGVAPGDVQMVRSGNNLIVKITGTTDQVTIQSYFIGDGVAARGYAVEQMRFADGTTWSVADVKALALLPTSGNDVLTGYATDDVINGADGDDTLTGAAGNDTLSGGAGNDQLYGNADNDLLDGGDGSDTLYGAAGDDQLVGGAGNDSLYGGESYGNIGGNDTLDGGAGNDYLMGGFGSDTYLFGRGDGQDTLVNDSDSYFGTADPLVGKIDVLQFKAGVAPGDVQMVRSGNNLIVKITGTTDQVTIQSYFIGDGVAARGYAVEQMRFADGTTWSVADVKALALLPTSGNDVLTGYATDDVINGADGNDTLSGAAGNDTLNGGAGTDTVDGGDGADLINGGDGDDTLYGLAGDDQLVGGAGNDSLYGGESYGNVGGNDTLDGGAGNDYLMGGFGSDTYLFGRGDGQDTLNNDSDSYFGTADPLVGKIDVLQFKDGVAPGDVALVRSGNNLIVKITGTTDQVTIQGYFIGDGVSTRGYAVEQLRFADGTVWDVAAVKVRSLIGAAGADTLTGYASDDVLQGFGGNDSLAGQGGNDALQGGDGNDTLTDSVGNNLFDGAAGVDSLTGGSGREIFFGGTGNDTINTGTGADVIAFAKGDGADIVAASTGGEDTLSLGGALVYADLAFRKSGNDLILDVGAGEQIAFQSWYSSTSNRSIVNLQVVAEAMAAFAAGGSDPLLDNKIEQFNFLGLVDRFDQARAATPGLTSWALSNALLDFHTGGSDGAALGGDLAYQYGLNRNLTGIGVTVAQAVVNDPQFGIGVQNLNAAGSVFTGAARLA